MTAQLSPTTARAAVPAPRRPARAPQRPIDRPRLGHRPALDGVRGAAVALVVARHFAPTVFPGAGVVGVALFFTLSGFLITTLLLEEHDRTGRVALGGFYLRRAARLLPAVAVMLTGYTVYALACHVGTLRELLTTLAGAATYTSDLLQGAHAPLLPDLGPLWSLSVEEQFYLAWPVLLVLAYRRGGTRRALRLLGALTVVGVAARALVALTAGTEAAYPLPVSWVDALLAGAAVALLAHRRGWLGTAPRGPVTAAGLSGAALLAATCLVPELKDRLALYAGGGTLVALAAAGLVLAAATGAAGAGVLRLRPAVWAGRLSYSVYLYNLLAVDLVDRHTTAVLSLPERRVAALALTVAAAAVSYFCVERPGQALVRRLADRRVRRSIAGGSGPRPTVVEQLLAAATPTPPAPSPPPGPR